MNAFGSIPERFEREYDKFSFNDRFRPFLTVFRHFWQFTSNFSAHWTYFQVFTGILQIPGKSYCGLRERSI